MLRSVIMVIVSCIYASVSLCRGVERIIPSKNVSALLVFGDSIVDQGNNNYINTTGKGNFLPYGMDFMGGKPTGRFSNGKTLCDLLAEALGVKSYLPPSLDPLINDKDLQTGVSFASGGSGFDPLTTRITSAIPMSVQLDMFKQYIKRLKGNIGKEATSNIITNSVVVILAGFNDLLLSFPIQRGQYDIHSYSNMLTKLFLKFLQEIYTLGVRRTIIFSLPPGGCVPEVRTLAGGPWRKCVDKENNAAQLFNKKLNIQLQFWSKAFPQSRVAFIDYYNPMLTIIQNPSKYGFSVVDIACCGIGETEVLPFCNKLSPVCSNHSEYFFWDGFHLTERGNNIILNQILQDLVRALL